ncbi:hypothetical protein WAX46_02450 [Bacillus sp. FJAT-53060]|nr:hypothetical protein [Bacillus stratosphericus]
MAAAYRSSLNVLYETDEDNAVTKAYKYSDSGQMLVFTQNGIYDEYKAYKSGKG